MTPYARTAPRLVRTRPHRPRSASAAGTARTRAAPATRSRTIAPELHPATRSALAKGPLVPNVAADARASHSPHRVEDVDRMLSIASTSAAGPGTLRVWIGRCQDQKALYS